MRKRAIFSICSNNYFPYARILFSSLKKHHPEASLFLCLADIPKSEINLNIDGVEVIPATELAVDNFADFAFRYDIMEFNTALKPFFFSWLIQERGFEEVVYLDPDIEVFAPLNPVFTSFEQGSDFTVTPHLTSPAEFAEFPDDIGIMKAGIYNLGFIGMNNSQAAQSFLAWWQRRLRYQCVNQQDQGIFVDQKFVDLLPAFHENVAILRNHTLNVAYWNIEQRDLTQNGDRWFVDEQPLVFFHFSGANPRQPERLSKHTQRFQDGLAPALRNLLDHYLAQLNKFQDESSSVSYAYGKFDNGVAIADLMRRCYREKFAPKSAKSASNSDQQNLFATFYQKLNQPADLLSHLSPWRITELMLYCWEQETELQNKFDLNKLQDRLSYTLWFVQNSTRYKIDDYFLTPILDTSDASTKKYQLILLLTKLLGTLTWQTRTLLKKFLWLPRKITKPLRLLLK